MDRKTFCEILTARKNELGLTWLELTLLTRIQGSSLQKVFSGNTNFFMDTAIKVMEAMKLRIIARPTVVNSSRSQRVIIDSEATLLDWLHKSLAASGYSVNKFQHAIGISRVSISANLCGKSRVRIDTFLNWAEATDYMVELV